MALTNLDVLSAWDIIPIATAYHSDGSKAAQFPATVPLESAQPVLPGWRTDISAVRSYRDLPGKARRYVERLEDLIEKPIRLISVGPDASKHGRKMFNPIFRAGEGSCSRGSMSKRRALIHARRV